MSTSVKKTFSKQHILESNSNINNIQEELAKCSILNRISAINDHSHINSIAPSSSTHI